jgi:hypothetical protein
MMTLKKSLQALKALREVAAECDWDTDAQIAVCMEFIGQIDIQPDFAVYLNSRAMEESTKEVTYDTGDVAEYEYDPPLSSDISRDCFVSLISVAQIDDGMYDLFDQHGMCWNEGNPFLFIPTKEEVREWVTTGKVKGKME